MDTTANVFIITGTSILISMIILGFSILLGGKHWGILSGILTGIYLKIATVIFPLLWN